MVWVGLTFHGETRPIFLPEKTSFDTDFYIKNVLSKAKEDGIRLLGQNFLSAGLRQASYQQKKLNV